MSRGDWSRIRPLLEQLLDLPVEQQQAFLDRECGDNQELKSRLRGMIDRERSDAAFLESDTDSGRFTSDAGRGIQPGALLGPWRLLGLLGSGGMGSVWLAERADGEFDKQVALKVLRGDLQAPGLHRRFEEERRLLARLEHPNISRLVDAGTTDAGLPWLAMEHVDGRPIDHHCDRQRLGVEQRLRLFLSICDAVRHAHKNLIVHRDLKPSNILVDEEGAPRLLDFGIAKLLAEEQADPGSEVTRPGARPFTPRYASPEQVRGDPVTTSTDVYSLGVLLFELLTGQPPYEPHDDSSFEMSRTVRETEAARPSSVARTGQQGEHLARVRDSQPRVLSKRLSGDLDTIVAKALQKDPEKRYTSVEQLAEDIVLHLDGLPIRARADHLGYRLGRYMARHRVAVLSGVVVILALIGATVVSGLFAVEAGEREREAVAAQQQEEAARERSGELLRDLLELNASYVFDFAEKLQRFEGTTEVRLEMARRAVEQLDRLAGRETEDPDLLLTLSRAYVKFGDLLGNPRQFNVGDLEGARMSYRKAEELLSRLERDDRTADEQVRIREELLEKRGDLLVMGGEFEEGVEAYRLWRDSAALRVAADPADDEARRQLARALALLGSALGMSGRHRETLPCFEEALEIHEQRHDRSPGDPGIRFDVAQALAKLGGVVGVLERTHEAVDHYTEAVDLLEELLEEDPGNPVFRTSFVETSYLLARFHFDLRQEEPERIDVADAHLDSALEVIEPAVRAEPDNAFLAVRLGSIQLEKARLLEHVGWRLRNQGEEWRPSYRLALDWAEKGAATLQRLATRNRLPAPVRPVLKSGQERQVRIERELGEE